MARSLTLPYFVAGLLGLATCYGHAQETVSSLASYEQLIAELQNQPEKSGANLSLSEAYAGLGSNLQTLERHADAISAFGEALQLLRESKGLFASEQFQLLQSRLVSSQALQAWEQVDDDRHLAYQIALKNPDAGLAMHYQALRELGLWKLRVAEEGLMPNALDGAEEASRLYQHNLEDTDTLAIYKGNPLLLANLYLDWAALEFLQAKRKLALPLDAYATGGPRTAVETYCDTIVGPDGRSRQVCRNIQVPNLDYFMSLSDRKYEATWGHLQTMQDAVLGAWAVLLPEVDSANQATALKLLAEVHSLTGAYNDFVAKNGRAETGTRIAAPTGSRISH